MTKLSEKIITKITAEKITPIPKWHLLLKSNVIWAMATVSVVFGAVSVAIGLHLLLSPIDLLPAQSSRAQFWQLLSAIPYFWLILLAIFVYVAYHNFIHTEDGYKWRTVQIFGATIGISIVIGVILLFSGFAPRLNSYFVQHVPGYTMYGDMRGGVWMNPQQGRLAGKIVAINTRANTLTLRDLRGKLWKITCSQATISRVSLSKGEFIKVLGTQTDATTFDATEFRPWEGNGMMRNIMQGNGGMMRITR